MYKVVLLSVAGAVVVGGAAVYLLFGNNKGIDNQPKLSASQPVTPIAEKAEPISGQGTLQDLLARAMNLECEISYTRPGASLEPVSGTYFTSAGKVRGDFMIPEMEPDSVSSVIISGQDLYSWSVISGETYGVKMDLMKLAEMKAEGKTPNTQEPVPMDQVVQYECRVWDNVDGSIFEPPTNVLFKDFSDIMNVGMEFGNIYEEAPGKKTQCELCDQVAPGEGQDECKVTFKCE